MSGMSHLEPTKFKGMRRNHISTVKVEEKRLQKLLDFIDNRMQDQRSKLRRQIEDTQQSAEDMEDKKHKATLQLLKNYFEVTSGRVKHNPNGKVDKMHDERMMGVLSEPSLATVPEIDPDVLAKPRSMYDRLTRTLDTSRLPNIAPRNRNIITTGSKSLPASMPNSNRSDVTDDSYTGSASLTPLDSPRSTPRDTPPSDATDESFYSNEVRPLPIKESKNGIRRYQFKTNDNRNPSISNEVTYETTQQSVQSPSGQKLLQRSKSFLFDKNNNNRTVTKINYDSLNGQVYHKGPLKPTTNLSIYEDPETPTPRLGDIVVSKNGLSRHSSLKRPMGRFSNMSGGSTMSLSELQPTRKQQAASKLKHALKGTIRLPR